jgi:general secretion pathway protein K
LRYENREAGGFALLVVLWMLVLIAFLVAHLTATGRTEIRIASNLIANSVAQAAADGAVFEAIFNLSDPRPEQRWPVDGTTHQIVIGNSRVVVRLEDEASWINPSTASPQLMEALLRITGSDPDTARRLAAAIAEWVGSGGLAQPQGGLARSQGGLARSQGGLARPQGGLAQPQDAVLAEYQAAGLDYGPPGAPIETLDELGRVLGMTPELLAAIRPHLTLFGPPEPNFTTTDPVVAAALALLAPQAGPVPPPANQAIPELVTVRITALASGPSNARVTRIAVVRIGASLPQGYSILAWSNGLDTTPPQGVLTTSLTR